MTPERWAKIEEIFQAVLDREWTRRDDFLEKECGGDAELCAEVKKLLRRHETDNSFLEMPVWSDSLFIQTTLKNQILSSLDQEVAELEENDSPVNQKIGAYRLTEEIGRGGMGVVYAARRDEDFRQQVALKIVKRGMETDFILRRFRQERQILAALDHPNIARLFDGGTTSDGRPYLVMEFIEGKPIDDFCDERQLTIAARLRLFQEVCAAVAFSHQRLVIHRDLKPSNILVTADGTAKLLDFGIAKLLDESLQNDSYQPTAANTRMMTPDYASPEQLRGETVTTVSDVYSLGVILYYLLTGNLPFDHAAKQPQAFALMVSEQKPERPSAMMTSGKKTTARNGDKRTNRQSLAEIAEKRGTQPEALRRHLAEDLDNIVLKALHKDSARRYSTVDQFSEDIRRHLTGLPVKARGDDFAYKTRKFIGRHKKSVAAAVLLALTLIGGITTTAWQARRADQERVRAESESERAVKRFADARRLTESLMFELHDAIRDLQGATAARELLAKRTLEHLDSLALDAAGDADLQTELAIAYINLGNIQGNPYYSNLGDTSGALESYRKAEKLTEELFKSAPDNVRLARRFWLTQIRIADVLAAQGNLPAAQTTYANADSLIERLTALNPSNESLRGDLATSYDRRGNVLMKTKDFNAALESFNKAQQIFEENATAAPKNDSLQRAVAAGHGKIGTAYLRLGAPEKALSSYQKLLQINQSRLAKNPANAVTSDDVGGSWREVGDAQMALGDLRQALESYRRQLEIYENLSAADFANVKTGVELAISHQRLGYLRSHLGETKGGLENHEKALAILQEMRAKNPQNLAIRNETASVDYYLGEVNFTLAAKTNSVAKISHLNKALSFFEQSLQEYSALPPFNITFPRGVNQSNDIQNRIDACKNILFTLGVTP